MTVVASDDFSRADAATLGTSDSGDTWVEDPSPWSIASNVAHGPALSGYRWAVIDVGEADAEVTLTMIPSPSASNDCAVIVRYGDSGNHILFNVVCIAGAWLCRVFQKVGGGGYTGLTTLQNPPTMLGNSNFNPFRARLVCTGTDGEAFLTDQTDLNTFISVGTWSGADAGLTATRHGMAASDSSLSGFDGFSIDAGDAVTTVTGTASGAFTFTGTAQGIRERLGQLAGVYSFTGSMAGARERTGALVGAYAFSGTAAGRRTATGQASAAVTFVATITGRRSTAGTAAGAFTFTGSLRGEPFTPISGIGGRVSGPASANLAGGIASSPSTMAGRVL